MGTEIINLARKKISFAFCYLSEPCAKAESLYVYICISSCVYFYVLCSCLHYLNITQVFNKSLEGLHYQSKQGWKYFYWIETPEPHGGAVFRMWWLIWNNMMWEILLRILKDDRVLFKLRKIWWRCLVKDC